MKNLTIGIDISKRFFQVFARNEAGQEVISKRLTRAKVKHFFAQLPEAQIGMEACGSSNYWARVFKSYGHKVKLIAPQHVKPYVRGNKNDKNDAEAICEALTRPGMLFVSEKSIEQQDVLCLHRIRERLVKSRTALVNELRGLLGERGIVITAGISRFRLWMRESVSHGFSSEECSELFLELVSLLYGEFLEIDKRIEGYEEKIKIYATQNEACKRLQAIPGIGYLIASALVASIDAHSFKNSRQLSAWLGLVPRQHSSGGKERLLSISKRGDSYLRKILIHGARSCMRVAANKTDKFSVWIQEKKESRGSGKTIVAIANKNARIICKMLQTGEEFRKRAA